MHRLECTLHVARKLNVNDNKRIKHPRHKDTELSKDAVTMLQTNDQQTYFSLDAHTQENIFAHFLCAGKYVIVAGYNIVQLGPVGNLRLSFNCLIYTENKYC